MNHDINADKYRAAYDEAALELRKIHTEFEQLCLRKERIAKVVEVLKPKVGFDGHVPTGNISLTTKRSGMTIVTRLAVLEKNLGVQE
jgi:hypothetical protein